MVESSSAEGPPVPTWRAARLISRVEDEVCVWLMIGLLALLFVQIAGRLLPWTFAWTEELSRYVFVWIVLVGGSAAVRTGDHVALQLLETLVPRARAAIRLLVHLAVAAFGLLLAGLGSQQTLSQYAGQNTAYSLPLPLWVVWVMIPLSFAVSSLWALGQAAAAARALAGKGP